jgi:tRNA nucleotidyltransferase (CCA-adding enzyme)
MSPMAEANLIDKLARSLPAEAAAALVALTNAARDGALALYLVGGSVRDLLLGQPTMDVDTTLEGDAPALATRVAERLPGVRCLVHSAFGTATLKGAGFRLDVATARVETYQRPGALPTVRAGSLRDDLSRRDFTVNALALALTGSQAGDLIDPFDGSADLEAGLLRVLHEGSFRDDATRILRGARYESRLGFRLERRTLRWLKRDVSYLETISGSRIRDELHRALREPRPERILLRLQRLGALAAIHPALSFDSRRARAFAWLREMRGEPPATACLALLAWGLSPKQAAALAVRLALTRRETEAVRTAPQARALEGKLSRKVRPSRAVDLLSPLPPASVWALAASAQGQARQQALRYLQRWRHVKPSLDGRALMAMGAREGPALGEALRRLKTARLDGEVHSRRDEERMARALLRLGQEGSR